MQPIVRVFAVAALVIPLVGFTSSDRQRAIHALNRLSFGARPGDVERVLQIGVDRWIESQLQPAAIADSAVESRLARFNTLKMSNAEMVDTFYRPIVEARRERKRQEDADPDPAMLRQMRRQSQKVMGELSAQRIIRAVESERQLNEVMVDFWMNHFNVYAGKGIDRFLLTSYERDTIRPNIWGRFEELVMATAKSPAMLFYLDNARSMRGKINENYARELMELHTLGVDGGYTQKDVTELARVLTGWSIRRPQQGGAGFVFRSFQHDRDPKTVLGVKLPGDGGIDEGEKMVRLLANHPSTATHIAYKLAQRLVADEPPKALVDRVAKRFLDTKGDLRETVKAVIESPEFWNPKVYRTKVKSPFEYAVSAIRAMNGKIENPLPLARELQKMGQPLYFAQPPTGYADTAEAWVNSGALLNRLNFALALASSRMPGIRVTVPHDPYAVAGLELSEATRKTIAEKQTSDPATIAGLVLGSPEFQKQ
jgi:uncharacterized protein (DUF1800 family)